MTPHLHFREVRSDLRMELLSIHDFFCMSVVVTFTITATTTLSGMEVFNAGLRPLLKLGNTLGRAFSDLEPYWRLKPCSKSSCEYDTPKPQRSACKLYGTTLLLTETTRSVKYAFPFVLGPKPPCRRNLYRRSPTPLVTPRGTLQKEP